jgi:hypothetical protein
MFLFSVRVVTMPACPAALGEARRYQKPPELRIRKRPFQPGARNGSEPKSDPASRAHGALQEAVRPGWPVCYPWQMCNNWATRHPAVSAQHIAC